LPGDASAIARAFAERRDLTHLLFGIRDAARRVEQVEPVAEPGEHLARVAFGEAARQHEVRRKREDALRARGAMGKRGCLTDDGREIGVGCVDGQRGDLAGVGERQQQLIGAQIDRDDALRGGLDRTRRRRQQECHSP